MGGVQYVSRLDILYTVCGLSMAHAELDLLLLGADVCDRLKGQLVSSR